ncbi:MAG: hypothetical protein JWQ97_3772 [Phenylobacterium sp.]|nr:hypothetical protein [Phenylobacterium sp.]
MDRAPSQDERRAGGEIVDFDEALLDACSVDELCEIMTEAVLLAQAFAPEGPAAEIEALANSLQSGVRDLDIGRAHARRLAAALRRLARGAQA